MIAVSGRSQRFSNCWGMCFFLQKIPDRHNLTGSFYSTYGLDGRLTKQVGCSDHALLGARNFPFETMSLIFERPQS